MPLRSQGYCAFGILCIWEGPLGTPLGSVQWKRTLTGGSQIGTCRNPWAAAGRRAPSAGQLTLLQMLLSPGAGQSLPQDDPLKSKGPEYYSAIKKNTFESVLMRWMKLEPIIQSEESQKEKHQYSILTHISGI